MKSKLFSGEETAAGLDDRNYDKYFLNRDQLRMFARESSKKLIHQLASKRKSFPGDINLCNVPALML